tara:strand:+ start:815 stop:1231 length:417 start_codon:yes stop_codon:yes gene_type:complete
MVETIKEVISKNLVVVTGEHSVFYAAKRMADLDTSSTIIVGPGMKPIGIITEKDLVKRVIVRSIDPKRVSVAEIMTSPIKTVLPNTSIFYAHQLMHENNFRRLPVVNTEGKLLGLVSDIDIGNYFAEKRKQLVLSNIQ